MSKNYKTKLIKQLNGLKCCIKTANDTIDFFLDGIDILIEYTNKLKQAKIDNDSTEFNDLLGDIINFVNQYRNNNKLLFNKIYYWNLSLDNKTQYSNIKLEYNILNTNNAFQKLKYEDTTTIDNFYNEIIEQKFLAESYQKRLFYRECAYQNILVITDCYNT